MVLSKNETRDLYRKRAKQYDLWVQVYPLFGVDMNRYRRETISALALKSGDTVVELGCGTGLNFVYLQQAVGSMGKIIGVDLTDSMLDVARDRIAKESWKNIELVHSDLSEWKFPASVSAVFSTLALTLVPEYDRIIERASCALHPEGRLAVLDLKVPVGWPKWLVRFAAWLNKPFGVSLELSNRHPWESISRYLIETEYKEYYFGALYLCAGKKVAQ